MNKTFLTLCVLCVSAVNAFCLQPLKDAAITGTASQVQGTLTATTGSTLVINGALNGAPTGGSLTLSAVTIGFGSNQLNWSWVNKSGSSLADLATRSFSSLQGVPTTLAGYGIADAQPLDSDLTAIAALSTTTYGRSILTVADAAALRTAEGVVIGTNVEAWALNLDLWAAVNPSSYLTTALAATTYATITNSANANSLSTGTLSDVLLSGNVVTTTTGPALYIGYETKTSSFTAVANHRYFINASNVVVTMPSTCTYGQTLIVRSWAAPFTVSSSAVTLTYSAATEVVWTGTNVWRPLNIVLGSNSGSGDDQTVILENKNNTAPNQAGQSPGGDTLLIKAQADLLYEPITVVAAPYTKRLYQYLGSFTFYYYGLLPFPSTFYSWRDLSGGYETNDGTMTGLVRLADGSGNSVSQTTHPYGPNNWIAGTVLRLYFAQNFTASAGDEVDVYSGLTELFGFVVDSDVIDATDTTTPTGGVAVRSVSYFSTVPDGGDNVYVNAVNQSPVVYSGNSAAVVWPNTVFWINSMGAALSMTATNSVPIDIEVTVH